MAIPSQLLPTYQDNPILTAQSNANALGSQNLANQKAFIENQFLPIANLANALSKSSYGFTAPAQAFATLLSGPAASKMSNEQYANLVNMFQRSLPNASANAYMNNLQNALTRNLSRLGYGGIPQQNSVTSTLPVPWGGQQPQQQPSQQSQPTVNQPQYYNDRGEPIPYSQRGVTPNESTPPVAMGYGTPSARQAGQNIVPGSMGGMNANTAEQVQQKGAETAATTQAQVGTTQWDNAQTQASNAASLANNLRNSAKGFHSAYQRSFYKGARLGSLPSQGLFAPPTLPGNDLSDEQLADRYANQMTTALAPTTNKGHITDTNFNLVQRLKLARPLDEQAEQSMYKSTLATADRLAENQDFYNYIRQKNPDITRPEADSLLNAYNEQMPPYDFETLSPLPQNKGKWRLYASPQALDSLRTTGSYMPKEARPQSTKFAMPKFNSKKEFQVWFRKLSPERKNMVRKTLGGV